MKIWEGLNGGLGGREGGRKGGREEEEGRVEGGRREEGGGREGRGREEGRREGVITSCDFLEVSCSLSYNLLPGAGAHESPVSAYKATRQASQSPVALWVERSEDVMCVTCER